MPTIVDSTQCHLWTDALHARQLARESLNKWDRGTYVRMCVTTSWTALEVACQEALARADIGYRFKDNLDQAIAAAALPPIDWSTGVWQKVRILQELRKSYIHRFAILNDMFPHVSVAEEAIETVRKGIKSIYAHLNRATPTWTNLDDALGWQIRSRYSAATLTTGHAGVDMDDPLAVRIYIVICGEEKLTTVLPAQCNPMDYISEILQNAQSQLAAYASTKMVSLSKI